jgi:hypothetical protein
MEKTESLVLMYSIISVFIMNLTYITRISPDLPCTVLFDDDEWKILYSQWGLIPRRSAAGFFIARRTET